MTIGDEEVKNLRYLGDVLSIYAHNLVTQGHIRTCKERDTELIDQLGQASVDNVLIVSQNETTKVVFTLVS